MKSLKVSIHAKLKSARLGVIVIVVDPRCQAADIDLRIDTAIACNDKDVVRGNIDPETIDRMRMDRQGITQRRIIQPQIRSVLEETVGDVGGMDIVKRLVEGEGRQVLRLGVDR